LCLEINKRKNTFEEKCMSNSRVVAEGMSPFVTHPREDSEEMNKGDPPSPVGDIESQHMFNVAELCDRRLWASSASM
jgi:hypothetical protein